MTNLKKDIKPNYLVRIFEGWGLTNPGSNDFAVYPDGSFLKTKTTLSGKDYKDSNATSEEGKLSPEALAVLKKFLEDNIKQNIDIKIYDYSCSIEFKRNGEVIKVHNDKELFNQITKLIPF